MSETQRGLSWNLVIAGLWLLTLVAILVLAHGDGDAYSDRVALARGLGWQSSAALVAALCVKPVSRWVRETAKLRRALGLAAASSAVIHTASTVSSSPLTLSQQLEDAHLRFGFGALIVLLLLGITSFAPVVAWLRLRSWKELHRLVYVAWICAVLHAFTSPYAFMPGVFAMALTVSVVSSSKLMPRRRRPEVSA